MITENTPNDFPRCFALKQISLKKIKNHVAGEWKKTRQNLHFWALYHSFYVHYYGNHHYCYAFENIELNKIPISEIHKIQTMCWILVDHFTITINIERWFYDRTPFTECGFFVYDSFPNEANLKRALASHDI